MMDAAAAEVADVARSSFVNQLQHQQDEDLIPSVIDGLTRIQRKVLFSAFKLDDLLEPQHSCSSCNSNNKNNNTFRVASLVGYTYESAAYCHGQKRLSNTIFRMMQQFVGTNNLRLLQAPGKGEGTRQHDGQDTMSPLYVYTGLNPIARCLFPILDNKLLSYRTEHGQSIEPEWYVPIVPMLLINGNLGAGSKGRHHRHPVCFQSYNPQDMVRRLQHMLEKSSLSSSSSASSSETSETSPPAEMQPTYKGFVGVVEPFRRSQGEDADAVSSSFVVRGKIERVSATHVHISELPFHRWSVPAYKRHLDAMVAAGSIKTFKESHTDTTVSFLVELTSEQMEAVIVAATTSGKKKSLSEFFELESVMPATSMVAFAPDGVRKKCYPTTEAILDEYCTVRMDLYRARIRTQIAATARQVDKLSNTLRFLNALVASELVVQGRKRDEIVAQLDADGYLRMPPPNAIVSTNSHHKSNNNNNHSDFDYLLNISNRALTEQHIQALVGQLRVAQTTLGELQQTTPQAMWLRDLDALQLALNSQQC